MAEELTPKQILWQKIIAVTFTLVVFVFLVWLILYLTVEPVAEQ